MNVVRTLLQLLGIWVDNTTGAITAQDGRDFIYSAFGYEAVVNPTVNNDNVDSAGIGAFFDCGSRWQNTATGRQYFCSNGAPGAAVWWVMMYDGQVAGGALGGTYPNPDIANTGVTPGTYGDSSHYAVVQVNPAGQLTAATQFALPGSSGGTVTSVGLTLPSEFSISGSPVTIAGTIAGTWANQTANRVFAGPSTGAPGTPGFRALVTADLPAGLGTVTSVGLTLPGDFSVAGSPVTGSGGFTVTRNTQVANTFLGGPVSGGAATPAYRTLVAGDLPSGTATSSLVANTVLTNSATFTTILSLANSNGIHGSMRAKGDATQPASNVSWRVSATDVYGTPYQQTNSSLGGSSPFTATWDFDGTFTYNGTVFNGPFTSFLVEVKDTGTHSNPTIKVALVAG